MDDEQESMHEAVEEQIREARLFPHVLIKLHAEYRRNALQHPSQREFWLSACRLVNEQIERYGGGRKVGTAFADQELPLRREN